MEICVKYVRDEEVGLSLIVRRKRVTECWEREELE